MNGVQLGPQIEADSVQRVPNKKRYDDNKKTLMREAVHHWVERGPGGFLLQPIRAAMESLWLQGRISLTPTDNGDYLANPLDG
jgi:hypothetical protein